MIKLVDAWEFLIYKIFISCRKAWVLKYKDLIFISFFSLITVFYFVEVYIWLKTKGLLLG